MCRFLTKSLPAFYFARRGTGGDLVEAGGEGEAQEWPDAWAALFFIKIKSSELVLFLPFYDCQLHFFHTLSSLCVSGSMPRSRP